jgi:hypothetical protein
MWKLQNICVNTTERLYEYCRTFIWTLYNFFMDTVERLCRYTAYYISLILTL